MARVSGVVFGGLGFGWVFAVKGSGEGCLGGSSVQPANEE